MTTKIQRIQLNYPTDDLRNERIISRVKSNSNNKTLSNKTKDIVTFKFVADALGSELNTTVKWFIVIIIGVFDPLAVCLILSYNVVLFGGKKEEILPVPLTKELLVESPPVKVEPVISVPVEPKAAPVAQKAPQPPQKKIVQPAIRSLPTEKKILLDNQPKIVNAEPTTPPFTSAPPTIHGHILHDSEYFHTPNPHSTSR